MRWVEIALVSVFVVGYVLGAFLSGRSLKLRLLVLSGQVVLLLASLYWTLEATEIVLGSAFVVGYVLGAFLWGRLEIQLVVLCALFVLLALWLY
ncbi:MAG: hypothetical protein OYG32_08255 [Rhodospirillaceae bacterium]|nr:hypothetical protein [Rhodospirillaceae bacterium]MDE0254772.1 hypothetical protein [Rhodospirillaceae bacterium]